jgi:hypothetical protein
MKIEDAITALALFMFATFLVVMVFIFLATY